MSSLLYCEWVRVKQVLAEMPQQKQGCLRRDLMGSLITVIVSGVGTQQRGLCKYGAANEETVKLQIFSLRVRK